MTVNKWDKINLLKIPATDSILNALKKMDETYKRLLLVFQDDSFINVLSIGDIQRAIIQNKPMDTPVYQIIRKNTIIANIHDSISALKQQMLEHRAECMPILNNEKQLVDVIFWEDLFPPEKQRIQRALNLPVVIMAGGKGSRLKPLTSVLPKPLIPIGDKPIIEHIMEKFLSIGSDKFYISINYKSNMIKHYFTNENEKFYNISYIEEEKPLGTAGSLCFLKKKIKKSFFITNCDILIDEDYHQIYDYHKANNNELTIIAALKHLPIPYGTLITGNHGLLEVLDEKPELTIKINSGMYILEPKLLDEIPNNEFYNITDLIKDLLTKGIKVGVFPVNEKAWKDIGDWNEYLKYIM